MKTSVSASAVSLIFLVSANALASPDAWVGPKCFAEGWLRMRAGEVQGSCVVRAGPSANNTEIGQLDSSRSYPVVSAPRGTNGWVQIKFGADPLPTRLPGRDHPVTVTEKPVDDTPAQSPIDHNPAAMLLGLGVIAWTVGVLRHVAGSSKSWTSKFWWCVAMVCFAPLGGIAYALFGIDRAAPRRQLMPLGWTLTAVGLVLAGLAAAGVRKFAGGGFHTLWIAGLSLVTFAAYAYDKAIAPAHEKAEAEGRKDGPTRVPEVTLHLLALAGGFAGGWLGMALRHKINKPVFPIILLIATIMHVTKALNYW